MYPEPGWNEYHSTWFIFNRLKDLGFTIKYGKDIHAKQRLGVPEEHEDQIAINRARHLGVEPAFLSRLAGGYTGLVATWDSGRSGPHVAFRMDIDANIGNESTSEEHIPVQQGIRSQHPGIHHSCGHDGHSAIGIALAEYIDRCGGPRVGTVTLIFQPAEEGLRGAESMVATGILDDVDRLYSLHIGLQASRTGVVIGGYTDLLSSIKMDVNLLGRGAHAGFAPHQGNNALLAATDLVQQMMMLPSVPYSETRVNVGSLIVDEARNVIPSKAALKAEVRASTMAGLNFLTDRVDRIIRGVEESHQVQAEQIVVGKAMTASSDEEARNDVAEAVALVEGVTDYISEAPFGASDDISTMLLAVQKQGGVGTYIGLGSDLGGQHHTDEFSIDQTSLVIGWETMRNIFDKYNVAT